MRDASVKLEIPIAVIKKFHGLLRGGSQLANSGDEGQPCPRLSSIATVGDTKFAPKLAILQWNQFHPACQHLIACKAGADQRDTQAGSNKALDHANTG